MTSPIYSANNLIIRANNENIALTPLKLQKLLYILYARCLQRTDTPLFPNRFEVWQHGPVVGEVYTAFRSYGARHIDEPLPYPDRQVYRLSEAGVFAECLDEVWYRYGKKSGSFLVKLTHGQDSAWSKAKERDGCLGGLLSDDDIREDGTRWFA